MKRFADGISIIKTKRSIIFLAEGEKAEGLKKASKELIKGEYYISMRSAFDQVTLEIYFEAQAHQERKMIIEEIIDIVKEYV